jgi:hypothetical protein
MAERKSPTPDVELFVLVASRRRCCICYGLNHDDTQKEGQIAHINRDPSDSTVENLAFMCLEHHNWYDSRTSQSKGPTVAEAKHYRDLLYKEMSRRDEIEMKGSDSPVMHPEPRVRVYRPPSTQFQHINVEDERLKLRWILRRPLKDWCDLQDVTNRLSPESVRDILDGPFHAVEGCYERLAEGGGTSGYGRS